MLFAHLGLTLALLGLGAYTLYYVSIFNGSLGVASINTAEEAAQLEALRGLPIELMQSNLDQMVAASKQAEAGVPIKELCRKGGFSDATFYKWRAKFGGMEVPDAKRLRELESENAKLKKLLAEAHLDIHALKGVFGVKR